MGWRLGDDVKMKICRFALWASVAVGLSACQTIPIMEDLEKLKQTVSAAVEGENAQASTQSQEVTEQNDKAPALVAQDLNQAPSVSPYQGQIDQFIRLGDRTRAGGDLPNAIGFYQKAYALDQSYHSSLYRLIDGLRDLGDRRGAESLLSEAVSESPNDVKLLRKYGNVLIERDKLPQALIQFERALEIKPNEPETLNSMAVAYDLQGRHNEAQNLYEKSSALEPDNLRTLSNYALSLALSGDTQKAIEKLRPYETDPTVSKRLKMNLALIYGLNGQNEAARRVAGQVLDREAVENNIKVYEALRTMTAEQRKNTLLKNPGKSQPRE